MLTKIGIVTAFYSLEIVFTLQGESDTEKLLGVLVFLLEVTPQLFMLMSTLLHWHTTVTAISIDLFGSAVNVPLR